MTTTGIVAALVLGALLLVALYALKREQEAHSCCRERLYQPTPVPYAELRELLELRERCKALQETVRRQRDAIEARQAHADRLDRERREACEALDEVDEDRAQVLNERNPLAAHIRAVVYGDGRDPIGGMRDHLPARPVADANAALIPLRLLASWEQRLRCEALHERPCGCPIDGSGACSKCGGA